MRYLLCLFLVLLLSGCRSSTPQLVPDRRGYLQEILLEGPTMLSPLYDDYSPENYRATKLDVVQSLPEAAEELGKELVATLVLGPGGALWEYNIFAFIRQDGYIAVRHMQVPHARITWKASGVMTEDEFAQWWQALTSHLDTQPGLWSPDASPEPMLLIGRYTPDGIDYWHASLLQAELPKPSTCFCGPHGPQPCPESLLGQLNILLQRLHMTYSHVFEQQTANKRHQGHPRPFQSFDSWYPLGEAAKLNRRQTIQALVEQGVAIDSREQETGHTALHLAALAGHAELSRWLVEQGIPIDATTETGYTALMGASEEGRLAVVQQLVDAGADTSPETSTGDTAFMLALDKHHYEVARVLHAHGANIDHQNNNGQSALHLAAEWGDVEGVRQLLDLGADISLKDEYGMTPLECNLYDDWMMNKRIVRMLMTAGATLQVDSPDSLQMVIESLVMREDWELMRDLLKPHPTLFRDHPEAIEIDWDEKDVAGFLEVAFDHGLDPRAPTIATLLIAAMNDSEALSMLLARDANVDARDDTGRTVLHKAIDLRNLTALRLILAADPDLNAADMLAETPLHVAIDNGMAEVAVQLIERGANPWLPNYMGQTPMGLAVAMHLESVVAAASAVPKVLPAAGDRVLTVRVKPADAFVVYLLRDRQYILPREQEEGRWIFRDLAPGTYSVRVDVPGSRSGRERVAEQEIKVDQEEQTVWLEAPGGAITFCLQAADGKSLDLSWDYLTLRHRETGLLRTQRLDNEDGAWCGELTYLLAGRYYAWLSAPEELVLDSLTITKEDFSGGMQMEVKRR